MSPCRPIRRFCGALPATCEALSVALIALASASAVTPAPAHAQATPPAAVAYVKGRILVHPRAGFKEAELDKLLKEHNGRRANKLGPLNVYVVELPQQANEQAVARALSNRPGIKYAELDLAFRAGLYPNDPYYGNAWHLPKIGAPLAWDSAQGTGVTIAILDTGVDANHPDLKDQLVAGWNTFGNNNDTTDVQGHGTSVAGVAAAAGNNSTGVSAVSFKSRIMPVRVTDAQGYAYSSTISQGLTWAADRGARVANISFQGVSASSAVRNAAQYMRNKGGVVIAAAGNTGTELTDPPSDLLTIVAATDANDARTSWSSYGGYVDASAPGTGIWTTTRGGGYGQFAGTSAASPVVAGVYGLVFSANPNLQAASADDVVRSTLKDLGSSGYDAYYGHGRVDAYAAVAKARGTSSADSSAPSASITSPSSGATVSGSAVPVGVSASDNTGVARVELYANNSLVAIDIASPYAFSWDTSALQDGPATLVAKVYDAAGNATSSAPVSVTVANDEVSPSVTITSPAGGSTVSGTVTITAAGTDNVKVTKMTLLVDGREVAMALGSSVSYPWDTGATTQTTNKGKGGGKGKKAGAMKTTMQSAAVHTITARAEDAAGNAASASINVNTQ